MGWAFFYMFVILKIPIAALLYIVWKAVQAVPEPAGGDDGGTKVYPRRHPRHPRPRNPRLPRRGGSHAASVPASPQRIRARATRIQRTHGR
jgi:hypothetical protein